MLRKPTVREKRYMANCNIPKPSDWLVESNSGGALVIVNKHTMAQTALIKPRGAA